MKVDVQRILERSRAAKEAAMASKSTLQERWLHSLDNSARGSTRSALPAAAEFAVDVAGGATSAIYVHTIAPGGAGSRHDGKEYGKTIDLALV